MSELPLVSVVIPTYNTARYLPAAVRSVLDQTYTTLEVVVVDDGSTDDTESVLKPFASDARFRYLRQANGGAASARNKGVQQSRGPLIAFLDSDDLWLPKKLELQVPLFADPGVGVVYGNRHDMDENDKEIPSNPVRFYRGRNLVGQMVLGNFVPMSSGVVRREICDKAGPFDSSLARSEDWDFWLRASLHTGFDHVKEVVELHRKWPLQLTKNKQKVVDSRFRILERFLQNHAAAVDAKSVRSAWARLYVQRGRLFASQGSRWAAAKDFCRALSLDWGYTKSVRELVKLAVRRRSTPAASPSTTVAAGG